MSVPPDGAREFPIAINGRGATGMMLSRRQAQLRQVSLSHLPEDARGKQHRQ